MPRVRWIIQQLIYNREELHSILVSWNKTGALKYVTTTCILLAVFLHDSWRDTNTFVNECVFSQWGKQSLCEKFFYYISCFSGQVRLNLLIVWFQVLPPYQLRIADECGYWSAGQ